MAKEVKSKQELTDMIMQAVENIPECANIKGVAITHPRDRSWDVAWVVDGNQLAHQKAWDIARKLQEKYDLERWIH